jgi:hypothetical protein
MGSRGPPERRTGAAGAAQAAALRRCAPACARVLPLPEPAAHNGVARRQAWRAAACRLRRTRSPRHGALQPPRTVRGARLNARRLATRWRRAHATPARADWPDRLQRVRRQDARCRPQLRAEQLREIPLLWYAARAGRAARLGLDTASGTTAGNALRYYFTVNSRYVRSKLKLLLCPFVQRGHWNRSLEQARCERRAAACAGAHATARPAARRGAAGCRRHQVQARSKRHQRARPVSPAHGLSHVLPAVLRGRHRVCAKSVQARGARAPSRLGARLQRSLLLLLRPRLLTACCMRRCHANSGWAASPGGAAWPGAARCSCCGQASSRWPLRRFGHARARRGVHAPRRACATLPLLRCACGAW